MKYELAKELEEAGFPQGGKGTWMYPTEAIVARSAARVYVPPLEELIEACGEEFEQLLKVLDWSAKAPEGVKKGWEAISIYEGKWEFGLTPTEAVARLWLVLNPKHHGN